MQKIHQDIIRQIFTLLLIVFLGLLIFIEIAPFLSGVLGAVTLYILSKKTMRRMVLKGWSPSLAASVIMLVSFVGILIPIGLTGMMLSSKVKNALQRAEDTIQLIKEEMLRLEQQIGINIAPSIDSEKTSDWLSSNLQGFLGDAFNIFIALSIMYFLLYYMLVNRKKFIESLYSYLPLRPENINILGEEITSMVKSNAIGIPLVAILQGFVALIGYLVLDVPSPWFWFVITAVGSMIPFIGTAVGIVPTVIILFASGNNWQAVVLLIYGIVVVGLTDNLFRLVVQKKLADIHPLITLIGVVIGVPLFGFIGLIFGPLLLSLFLLTLKIYKHEYGAQTQEKPPFP